MRPARSSIPPTPNTRRDATPTTRRDATQNTRRDATQNTRGDATPNTRRDATQNARRDATPNTRRDATPTAGARGEASGVRRAAQAIAAVRAAAPTRRAALSSPIASWLARRFLALWAIAVLATAAAFVAHLALRFETVRLGYDVGRARREQRGLVEQRRLLSLEAATLGQANRVEAVARGSLGMDVPEPARVVPMGARASRRASGGVR